MRRVKFLLLLGLAALAAASCKPKPSGTASAPGAPSNLKADFDRTHAAQVAEAEAWFQNNLLTAYEQHGVKDPRWDAAMRQLLKGVAHVRAIESAEPTPEVLALMQEIGRTPCDDPFFTYLCARYDMFRSDLPRKLYKLTDAYKGLKASAYGPLQKYYAAFRAGYSSADRPDVPDYPTGRPSPAIRQQYYNEAIGYFLEVLKDPAMYPREAANCIYYLAEEIEDLRNPALMTHAYETVGKGLLNRWPEDPDVLRAIGNFHLKLGWAARGGGYANTVSNSGARTFQDELEAAKTYLEKSWARSPHPLTAAVCMYVINGQGQDNEAMTLWFDRAMELDPNNDDACNTLLNYLQPRWYGTHEEMIEFGTRCIDSHWGGLVPIVGVKAFRMVAAEMPVQEGHTFLTEPANWAVMYRGYQRYFASVTPITDDPEVHDQYVIDAVNAGAWKEFLAEVRTHRVSAHNFGSQKDFDSVFRIAVNTIGDTSGVPALPLLPR